jgi:predicted PurR-regulated permease PerM
MDDKDIKKFMIPVIVILLAFLSFLIIKPLSSSICFGLLLAYIFYPLYLKLKLKVKSENFSAFLIVTATFLIIFIPPLLLIPSFIKELFEAYLSFTTADLSVIVLKAFPSLASSQAISAQISSSLSHFNGTISNWLLALFQNTIMNIPEILFGIIIILFTFFFALRDGHQFKDYFSTFFPFGEEHKNNFFKKFEQVTNSVVYGHLVIGIVQGLVAGVAYYMFGIPNALIWTVITTIVGVLPVIGPWLVWIPLDLYLFMSGNSVAGMQLLIYGVVVINWTDIILRPSVVAARAEMNSAIALIGAVGGSYAFGVIGFILGPLFLAYFILLVELYKNKQKESLIIRIEPESKT